jgi:tetratricopeptide (TPR) repeat protein
MLLDSLMKAVPALNDDEVKVRLYDTISMLYHNFNPDSGIIYGRIGAKMGEDLHFKLGMAKAYHSIALNYETKTQNPAALEYYYKALSIFEELKDNKRIAATLGNIGNIYASQKEYARAIEKDSAALLIYEQIKDMQGYEGQVRNLGNMAYVYQTVENYATARQYFIMALEKARKYRFNSEVAKNLGNLAALNYLDKKEINMPEALSYGTQAIEMYEKLGDKMGLASNYGNMGEFYLAIVQDSTGKLRKGVRENDLVLINKAIAYLNKGVENSRMITFSEGLIGCYEQLYLAYTLKKDYKSALDNYRSYSQLKDSVYSSANSINIANLETQRFKKEKEDQITINNLEKSNNSKQRFIYISGIILLLIAIGVVGKYFINEHRSNKKMAKERKKHIDRIRTQKTFLKDIAYIQSHEVRGPVSTILGLVQLFNFEDPADPTNKELMEGISTVASRLDKIVTEVVNRENQISRDEDGEMDKY